MKHRIGILAPIAGLFAALAAAPACRSARGWREDADREVYRLVEARRKKLAFGDGSFSIEPRQDSLRQRILRGEATSSEPLDLVQCLEIASENSREYQRQKEQLYLAALDLTLERWRFSVQAGGELTAIVDGTGDTATDATTDAGFSLTKLLGTGASIVAEIGLNLTHSLTTGDGWNPVGDVGLTITQPLLRGAGPAIVKEPLTQAERDLVYAVRSFERFRRTFAVDVAARVYGLLQRMDAVANQETNFENLKKLSERNEVLAQAGRLSDIDAGLARQDELRSGINLLDARERLERDLDEFRIFLGLPVETPLRLDAAELQALSRQDLADLGLEETEASSIALAGRLDHRTSLEQREDAERRVRVAQDALRAGLSITADYDNTSPTGEPGSLRFDDSTWSLTAALDLPLERLPERNSYRSALISREVAARAAEQSADRIRADVRDSLRLIGTRRESIAIQRNAVDLAARRIESSKIKLEAGRASTRDLLEAQDALLSAQNASTAALIDYTLAKLGLYLDMEQLRVEPGGIRLEDPRASADAAPAREPGEGSS